MTHLGELRRSPLSALHSQRQSAHRDTAPTSHDLDTNYLPWLSPELGHQQRAHRNTPRSLRVEREALRRRLADCPLRASSSALPGTPRGFIARIALLGPLAVSSDRSERLAAKGGVAEQTALEHERFHGGIYKYRYSDSWCSICIASHSRRLG